MSDISKIQTNGETYDVKDATARENLDGLATNMDAIRNMAQEAQETADTAQSTANSKVSSVNIGTVTTGDSPSVTNSGTDKDVVMDFVFPSGGGGEDSRIATGASDGENVYLNAKQGLFLLIDTGGFSIAGYDSEKGSSALGTNSSYASVVYWDDSTIAIISERGYPFSYIAIIKD